MIQDNPKSNIKSQPRQIVNHSFFGLKQLYRFINYFGLFDGTRLFLKVKSNRLQSIQLPGYAHPFEMRPNTTDIHMFNQIYFNQCYNISYPFEPFTIVDAGANIGLASIFFANHFPNSKIIAIEPESTNYDLLTKNTSPYQNIIPLNTAIWKNSQSLSLKNIGNGESGHVMELSNSEKGISPVTIDQIRTSNNFKYIDILKIDIEGSEKEIFEEGSENWLPKTKCIIVETHDHIRMGASKSVFSAISKHNYRTTIHGENLVFFNCDLQ